MAAANKCTKCKGFPMVVASGVVMCPRCRITSTSIKDWNAFMQPVDIQLAINALERPISVLKSIAVFTTDPALRGLAATTLKSLNELDFSECFTDVEEAKKFRDSLDKVL